MLTEVHGFKCPVMAVSHRAQVYGDSSYVQKSLFYPAAADARNRVIGELVAVSPELW